MALPFGADCRPSGKIVSMWAESSTHGAAGIGIAGEIPQRIAAGINLHILQAQFAKAIAKPRGPLALMEGRRGDLDHLSLPIHDPRLLQMKPLKGLVDRALAGEMNDAREGRRSFQIIHGNS